MRALFKALFCCGSESMRKTTSVEYYRKHFKYRSQWGSSKSSPNYLRGYVMGRVTGTPPCVWY